AFLSARRANPAAMLLINDYRVGADYEKVISELVDEAGRALYDAIGIQSHMHAGTWSMSKVWAVCERFGRFGVPLHFTEMTVLSGPLKTDDDWSSYRSDWQTTSAGEQAQADYVEKVYRLLFSHPAVQAITWWDLSDARAWQGAPAGLLRKDLSPKPAYRRLLKLIKDEWWTDAHASTGPDGRARLRIFRGQHRLTVRAPDGRRATVELTTTSDQPNRLTVRLQGTK
ncbi:MAG: endo-1,4-beta-xylanase, partial [Phycisphaerae bacterium]